MNFSKNTIRMSKKGRGIVFFVLFLLFSNYNLVSSATVDQLRDQIQKVTDTKAQLEREIAVYEQQLKDLGEQSMSLSNTIKSLNATINKNALDIKLTQNSIDSTQLQIEKLSLNIGKNVDTINQNLRAIASLLNQINNFDRASLIESLLKYESLSEFWNEQQNIYLIQNQIKEKVIETKNTKAVLEDNKVTAEKKKKDLLNFKSNLVDQKKVLDFSKKEKNKLLADTKNSETNYKKLVADKKALSEAFDAELMQFESELKFAIDKNSIPSERKGVLSWPLLNVYITQVYGYTDFGKTAYATAFHNGVDFRASVGTTIIAPLSGIVEGVGNTDSVCPGASFGKWVLIKHNNGLTTIYAHLSLIKVNAGDMISTGDIIGYSGNTGYSTGPHLHFGLYISQGVKVMNYKSKVCKGTYTMPVSDLKAYLDPLQYLPSL